VKPDIHPTYHEGEIVCGTCGTAWKIGSTKENMRVSICANCHPFYTGEQRAIVDTEGQVDRFMKKLATAQEKQADAQRRREQQQQQSKKPKKKTLMQEIYGEESGDTAEPGAAPATTEAGTTSTEEPA
jgi:large subunit ribosomal protein L31